MVALILVSIWPLSPEIAIGVMILAAAPVGATSNILTSFAKGETKELKSLLTANMASNFNDDEKIPLSLFWLGEISLLESNLDESDRFFQRLASDFPDHWRTPLAHKKIGE